MQCTKCGGALLANGACSACGYNEQVELEIGAFMTPHINRARIVLVAVGLLYAYVGLRAYGDVADVRKMMDAWSGADSPEMDAAKHFVNVLYLIVVFTIGESIANIVLAAIAGKKTMLAFNIAMGLFVVHTGIQIYAGGGAFIMSWVWWVTAIALGMGYQAARKAEGLRRQPPGGAPVPTL